MPEALFGEQRSRFHAQLLAEGILGINAKGVASNADSSSKSSQAYAGHIARALRAETAGERLPGQTAGGQFEQACANFLSETFTELGHLRPGEWTIRKVGGRGMAAGVSGYDQYAHLVDLNAAVLADPSLQAVLGNAYAIAPDVVVSRAPVSDEEINASQWLVDDDVAVHASLRASRQPRPLLHAVVSCKWTLRSDRAQNARSEALNLIRNRKGRLPHTVVVTGEPTPTRISSLALGTGDIDCVYHFALPELEAAVREVGSEDAVEMLQMMVEGKRLKDIADLPLDLAV
ncbi:NgoMIV family type II restriction endonuclease [uncultured Pseudokineococcus sp.]|uniref:NgoMIV family type II restriction endonuclease n=1 Tax=uncultured Pseudokineococcus sp. TaxID=1642928 RepID=UPI00260D5D45|nr:NgoMIV family type II restriction endonuclease [uncultured Pseudokineococcus sp.]